MQLISEALERTIEELAKLPPGPPDFEKVSEICSKYGIQFI